ncbi:hypothetical protein CDD82_1026 [Ophiocordyceps australis]|uniref:Acyltransferase 3 domain-containing protein n=1 Tax=Ophiocordyceps australis TaxID=1399860 RepID=A0A2C5ZH84_9HYPO|nr:hypothetical protein CDD82_1026 [Ophiocordyceps australis]
MQPTALYPRLAVILHFLLPSFVQHRIWPASSKPRRLFATSWLDGLRGVAAYLVSMFHYTEHHFDWYLYPYGFNNPDDHVPSSPLQLPFIRLVYSGRPMVHVFFVISGFVLSYKPLKLIRKHDYNGLLRTLSSSIFRRGFRLFLPVFSITLIVIALIRLGWIYHALPTFREQIRDWYRSIFITVSSSWDWDGPRDLPYNAHLWTIPIEYSNSLFLFLVLTGMSRLKTCLRLVLLVCIIMFCLSSRHWAPAEFLMGMGIAEVQLIQDAYQEQQVAIFKDEENAESENFLAPSRPRASSIWVAQLLFKLFIAANLIFALFVFGWPSHNFDKTPGISAIWRHTMEPFWSSGGNLWVIFPWYALSSAQLVLAIQQTKSLQKIFVTPLAQYLGNVSYSFYLFHGIVQAMVARHILFYLWPLVGGRDEAGVWGRMFVWFWGKVFTDIPTFWAADILWRTVDMKSVEWSRWIEGICTI